MWFPTWIFLFFWTTIFALEDVEIKLSIDYFKNRDVKYICLLTCRGDGEWSHKFAKISINESIAVSEVKINKIYFNIDKCLRQRVGSMGVILGCNCEHTSVLYHASQNLWFDSIHKWLLIDNYYGRDSINSTNNNDCINTINYYNGRKDELQTDNNMTNDNDYQLEKLLEKLNISVDADITITKPDRDFNYNLYEVYNFGKVQGGKLIISKLASWNTETGLETRTNLNGYKYYRRWNFQKLSMRMVAVISPPPKVFDPKMILGRNLTPGVSVVTRTAATVLHVVAEVHNFTFKYTITDRWIGLFDRNSSKVAATSLYFQDQDITPVIRSMKYILEKIGIVYPPVTYIETKYYYRIPTTGPGKYENQFLRPLSTGAWYSVIAVTTLCALILLTSAMLEQRPSPAQYAVFSVLATFCQQFFEDSGEQNTGRVSSARKLTVLITGISCVLIYNYYTSSVVSWLLNGPPQSINSLEELLESPLELIFEDIGYTRSWLQTSTYYYNRRNAKIEDELRKRKVFSKKKGQPLLTPLDEGIDMVKAGGYAYHTEVDTANMLIARKFTQSELCELGSLQSMEKTALHPAVQKNSPYKEFLNWGLIRLQEKGIISCIRRRTLAASVKCEGSSPRALALGGAAPAFILLAAGYLLAISIMLLERLTTTM